MKFESLREFCRRKNCVVPNFRFLEADGDLYRCVVIQPQGDIHASGTKVECSDTTLIAKFEKFLGYARECNANLALSPEYSCPWQALVNVLTAGHGPGPDSLWVLGCQSLSKHDLRQLPQRLGDGVTCLYDDAILRESVGDFIDPVTFVFRTAERTVLVLQFKTKGMGGIELERDHLVKGTSGFALKNEPADSITLAVLICSDALELKEEEVPAIPTLLVHLQANLAPRDAAFARYRSWLFDRKADSTEVVCLNWASQTRIHVDGKQVGQVETPHTALYTKSTELDLADPRLEDGHSNGLYYYRWQNKRAGVYAAAYDELCFDWKLTKPSQDKGNAKTCRRTGPISKPPLRWDGASWVPAKQLNDGASTLLGTSGLSKCAPCSRLTGLDLDRFLSLCAGAVTSDTWPHANAVGARRLDDDEVLRSVSFSRDPVGVPHARALTSSACKLIAVLRNTTLLQEQGRNDLVNASVDYKPEEPTRNLYSDGIAFGTIVYCTTPLVDGEPDKRRSQLERQLFGNTYARLYLWYSNGTTERCSARSTPPSIMDTPENETSITGTRRPQ